MWTPAQRLQGVLLDFVADFLTQHPGHVDLVFNMRLRSGGEVDPTVRHGVSVRADVLADAERQGARLAGGGFALWYWLRRRPLRPRPARPALSARGLPRAPKPGIARDSRSPVHR